MLSLTLFGPIKIARDGERIERFRSQTEIALLAYLAHTGESHTREAIADLLWDASSSAQSLSNLRTVLSRLRKQVGDELVITRKTVALRTDEKPSVDSVHLQVDLQVIGTPTTPAEAARLSTALRSYTRDFLDGFYLSNAPRFNDWVAVEQERLRQLAFGGLQRIITYALEEPSPPLGIAAAEKWLAIDQLHEVAHAHLIHLLAIDGQVNAALAQYDRLVAILDDELGVDPAPETIALIERVRRGKIVIVKESDAGKRADVPNNLPRELTPFIGRKAESTALVKRILDPAYPLLTVTGEGGMGKTRLVLAAARLLLVEEARIDFPFPDGVWFVSLTGIESLGTPREAVAGAIGSALGLSFHGDRLPSDQLLTWLQAKACLLVLDNLEHLLDTEVPDLIIDLLQAGPKVQLLVTSRAPLHLMSEYVLRLAGLPIPYESAPGYESLPGDPSTYASVRLFAERAARTGQAFTLSDCAEDVVAICRFVAGVPLGIELAAAWIGQMTCADISATIASNLDFLATTRRDVPKRQRSMRAVFNYSWALLDPTARQALAEASVFRGGFDTKAAAVILGDCARQIEHLVEHSLMERDADGRYTVHELLREFAAEKLQALEAAGTAANEKDVRQRHGEYFLRLVDNKSMQGATAEESIVAATAELDNVRHAWRWAVSGPHPTAMAHSWQGLWQFFVRRALFQEGVEAFADAQRALLAAGLISGPPGATRRRLEVARASLLIILNRYDEAIALAQAILTAADTQQDALLLAHARLIWGTAFFRQGHYDQALAQLEMGLAQAQSAEPGSLEADLRRRIGVTFLEQANMSRARDELQRALTIYRRAGVRIGVANVLGDLGWLEQRAHNLAAARENHTAALAIQRELDNRHGITLVLINLAGVCGMQRRFDEAIAFHREALANLEQIDDRYHRSLANHGLGVELSRLGDYAQARVHYERSLAIDQEIGDESGMAWCHNNLGLLYNHLGEYETALTLHREALSISQKLHSPTTEGLAWSRIAQDLYGLGRHEESILAFEAAIDIQQALNQAVWATESRAGLANAYLDLGRRSQALEVTEVVLPQLGDDTLQGAREPFRIYWNCYRVLDTIHDPRADDVLATTRVALQRQAEAIVDDQLRESFLHNIPSHRLILSAERA